MRNKSFITSHKTTGFAVFICIVIVLLTSIFIMTACDNNEHSHSVGDAKIENYIAPTATSDGSYDLVLFCLSCNEEISRQKVTLAKQDHEHKAATPVVENYKASTSTTDGSYDEVTYCGICNAQMSRVQKSIKKAEHSHIPSAPSIENYISATDINDGSYDLVTRCITCGEIVSSEPQTIQKSTHVHQANYPVVENYVAATAESKGGYDIVTRCGICNEIIDSNHHDIVAPTHSHNAGAVVIENYIAATEEETGSYDEVIYCATCNDEMSRVQKTIDIVAHQHSLTTPVVQNYVAATEESAGSYELVTYCYTCNKEIHRSTITIEKLVHSHCVAKPVIANYVAATEETDGGYDQVYSCDICHEVTHTNHVKIERLVHTHHKNSPVIENFVAATETQKGGYDLVVYCNGCNEEISCEHKDIAVLGHIHHQNNPVIESFVAATETQKGGYDLVVYCNDCNEEISREHKDIAALGHTHHPNNAVIENFVPATEEKAGTYDLVVYCHDCGELLSRSTQSIDKLEHKHNAMSSVIENFVAPTYGFNNTGTNGSYDEVVYCYICKEEISRTTHTTQITADDYYSKYDYLELSADTNSIENFVNNGDGTYTLNAKTNQGKSVTLLISGEVSAIEGGWGKLSQDTKVQSLSATPGVCYINYDIASDYSASLFITDYYSVYKKTSVANVAELTSSMGTNLLTSSTNCEMPSNPDYFDLHINTGSYVDINNMKIYFNNAFAEIAEIELNTNFYQLYVAGETYDDSTESNDMGFPMCAKFVNPLSLSTYQGKYETDIIYSHEFELGKIRDVLGKYHTRKGRVIQSGDQIEVKVGSYSTLIDLCVDTYEGSTLYDTITTQILKSTGTQNVLVIPVTFKDQTDRINSNTRELMSMVLGNVLDDDGSVTKHTIDASHMSLSEYIYTSSYGKLTVNSYIMENAYVFDGNASDYYNSSYQSYMFQNIEKWIAEQGVELSKFDQNSDGYFDLVIFINTLDMGLDNNGNYSRAGMSGSFRGTRTYYNDLAGTTNAPTINSYINIAMSFLFEDRTSNGDYTTGITANTLTHEFGHALGIDDYYDVAQSGINVLGGFDMQSDNAGDWNAFTKYMLGWTTPTIIDGSQDSYEITLGAYSTSGNSIVIRADGYTGRNTPFDEYITIDLFAHDGLYASDSSTYKMENAVGVRIHHVNAVYEQRTYEIDANTTGIVATEHYSASSGTRGAKYGKYLIELVQNGNVNTLTSYTSNDIRIDKDDLFYQGDTFSVEDYDQFFYNGKMDNGMEFGYKITVKTIVENGADSTATILIEKINKN